MDPFPPSPTPALVRQSVASFDADPRTAIPDKALTLLFGLFPRNTDTAQVLIKVATLNTLYATNIYGVTAVATHIVGTNVDDLLGAKSHGAVETIACVTIGGRQRRNYSFATKYCSWHKPDAYPIFDKFVKNMLVAYKEKDSFDTFGDNDLGQISRIRHGSFSVQGALQPFRVFAQGTR